MTALVGADVQALRELADQFTEGAARLREVANSVSGSMCTGAWVGPDASEFEGRWEGVDRVSLLACADDLEVAAATLRANADQQEAASAADDDGAAVFGVGGAAASGAAGERGGFPVMAGAAPAAGAEMPGAARGFVDSVDDMTPQQVHDAWDALDPKTQDWLALHRPYFIGNLDGIPFDVRATCNESEVVRLWNLFEEKRAWVRGYHPDWPASEIDKSAAFYMGLTPDQMGALKHIHSEFPGPGVPVAGPYEGHCDTPPRLVVFDLTGGDEPRAALAFGDLDHATDIGVYTPGMGSKVNKDEFHRHVNNAEDLYIASRDILRRTEGSNSESSVATVYWLGYDAPQSGSVLGAASSTEGAELFASFADGMDANNPNAHITAAGHSYGSIVVTEGAEQTDAIDTLVVFGSPGLGFNPDPHVPEAERYYGHAEGDWIADLPFGPLRIGKGQSPEELGYNRLPTEKVGGYSESTGHSKYLHSGTSFLQSLAAITVGHTEKIPGR